MINPEQYGWSALWLEKKHSYPSHLGAGRVTAILGFKYMLATPNGELEAELSGKLLFENESEFLPKVGDWVVYTDYGDIGYVVDVLPRENALSRRAPGRKTERQVLAANVDHGVIVQGLDRDFNVMRLDRYIVQIKGCGIKPVIVLNKADLVADTTPFVDEVVKLQHNVPVYVCSTVTGQGIAEVSREVFGYGTTSVLIGPSGAGKSSIINAVTGNTTARTGAISDFNNKGRHTTTTRDLFVIPGGGMVIDTPGMREFGATDVADDTAQESFTPIATLAASCRFSDCTHTHEEGCAVLKALSDGTLDPRSYDSYQKLIREQRRFQISAEEKKRQNKSFGKLTKEAKSFRKKYKY